LTATPTDFVEHDTFELLDCKTTDPTFAYSFEEAVNHIPPYLPNYLGWYRWLGGNSNALTPQAWFLTAVGSS